MKTLIHLDSMLPLLQHWLILSLLALGNSPQLAFIRRITWISALMLLRKRPAEVRQDVVSQTHFTWRPVAYLYPTVTTGSVTDGPLASEFDNAVFMQRSAPSRTSDRVYMRFVGLHGYFSSRFVDLSQSLSSQLEDRWSRIRRVSQPIVDTHTVEYPPTVGGTSYPMTILQYQDDYYEQINDDDVLAVITVILQEPERKEKLKVHWIPLKMTRQGFIFFTRMQGYCDRLEVLCTVYHNGQLWHDESSLRRRMQHGDHLRLHLRSSCFIWSDFEFAESLERRRRLFGSSSEEEGEARRESERSRPSSSRAAA